MRKFVLLTVAAAVLAITAVAYAVDNTMNYTVKQSHKGKPSKKKPAPIAYNGILHIDTNPPGQQPDVGPTTTLFLAKPIISNGKFFPSCTQAEVDGKPALSAKCKKAVVGSGTAEAYVGSTPGQDRSTSIHNCLDVKAINANAGKKLLLSLTTKTCPDGSTGPQVNNRVVPGTLIRASGVFGIGIRFDVPKDLQKPVEGIVISLTDFDVKIPSTVKTLRYKGATVKKSYLAETSCPGTLPFKAETKFDTGSGIQAKTSTGKSKC